MTAPAKRGARAAVPEPDRRRPRGPDDPPRRLVTPEERQLPGYAKTVDTWPWSLMQPITRPIRYSNNPRINDPAVPDVMASLSAFGAQQTIVVDRDNVIVVGDTRFLGTLQLRWPRYPMQVFPGTPEEAQAYRLADNKVGERAEWDFSRLKVEFAALEKSGVPLALTGFRDFEIAPIRAATFMPVTPATEDLSEKKRSDGGSNRGQFSFTSDQLVTLVRAADRYREGQPQATMTDAITAICQGYLEWQDAKAAT